VWAKTHAGRLGWPEKQVRGLAVELVEGLSGMGRPAEAAAVADGYLRDAEAAAALFCQAHEWREVRLALPSHPTSPMTVSIKAICCLYAWVVFLPYAGSCA
jgi:hypothetical protein